MTVKVTEAIRRTIVISAKVSHVKAGSFSFRVSPSMRTARKFGKVT